MAEVDKTEKITINIGLVDLGEIDLLVGEGFYANRTDFIRTAIRNQLERHADVVKQSTVRNRLDLGLRHYSREDLGRSWWIVSPILPSSSSHLCEQEIDAHRSEYLRLSQLLPSAGGAFVIPRSAALDRALLPTAKIEPQFRLLATSGRAPARQSNPANRSPRSCATPLTEFSFTAMSQFQPSRFR